VLRRRGRPPARTGTPADLLVVGLGNPGAEYARTRHNVGAEVVELLAQRHDGRLRRGKERARSDEVRIDGARVALAIPEQWMNESGDAVRRLVRRYGVEPEQLVVVHDELDLPVATLRVKAGGGLAGHNGLRSIASHLHTEAFNRVRIGVGKPASKERGADHVLSGFSKRDRAEIDVTIEQAADAVELIAAEGVDAAMNRYNGAASPPGRQP
jgi:peptidyl-tRNA hydrolase, PTH1 family